MMVIQGVGDIEDIFRKSLGSKEGVLRTVLSAEPLVYLCGEDFADWYMEERNRKGISLKSLRITSTNVDKADHKDYKKHNKEVRVNEDINLQSSIVLWDDHVAFIDPESVSGFVVSDKDHALIMREWFERVWVDSRMRSAAIDIAKKYFDYSNQRNLEGIESLLHDGATYSSENTGMYLGRENILAMTKDFFESFVELCWEVHDVKEEKPGVILFDFTLTGTKNDGEKIAREGLEYIVVHEGRIQHVEVKNK